MATVPVQPAVTPLRQRMLNDMAMRAMKSRTQHDYVRPVRAFAGFLGRSPDTATAGDVRRFQVHQREHGAGESVIGGTVPALRFLFGVTLDRPDLSRKLVLAPRPRKLPDVLSVDEVARLLEAAPGIKYSVFQQSRPFLGHETNRRWQIDALLRGPRTRELSGTSAAWKAKAPAFDLWQTCCR